MKIKRVKTFETNSSSSHSFTLEGTSNSINTEVLVIELDNFHWEEDTLVSTGRKLSYIVTALAQVESSTLADFILEICDRNPGIEKIVISGYYNSEFEVSTYNEMNESDQELYMESFLETVFQEDHYSIDHQSVGMLFQLSASDLYTLATSNEAYIQTSNDNIYRRLNV